MAYSTQLLIDLAVIAALWFGVWRFRSPVAARSGNLIAAMALVAAGGIILWRHPIFAPLLVVAAIAAGGAAGWLMAMRVNMLQIPAMVAFQHGVGGVAVVLVAWVELTRGGPSPSMLGVVSGLIGILLGGATFSGSLIAAGKLANRLRQTPVALPAHSALLSLTVLAALVLAVPATRSVGMTQTCWLAALTAAAAGAGVLFSMRIGGADMPVLISFLNATAGLAAAFCGIAVGNRLLIACGATVAASGSILTHVMCRAMNRDLLKLLGGSGASHPNREHGRPDIPVRPETTGKNASPPASDPLERAIEAARTAQNVIIVPGYGMALAHAQFETVQLADTLKKMGKRVRFAVHPIAGRMPGHMHVLLAEAKVDPNMLFDMDEINRDFAETDFVVIVGACDVVNPAANAAEETPISGMPILSAHEAKNVAVCNLDARPGYSGVDNPLYDGPNAILLFGDAKATLGRLLERLA